MAKLLIVDDEPGICYSFRRVFASQDVEVLTAGSVDEGWRSVLDSHPDVIVVDVQLPDGSGIELFDRIVTRGPKRPTILISAQDGVSKVREAMGRGAFDYLTKPIDLSLMSRLLDRAFEAASKSAPESETK